MLKFVTNPIKPLPALDLIEYRHVSISVNLLEFLHNQRLTEYNKIFGACKGARDFRISPPIGFCNHSVLASGTPEPFRHVHLGLPLAPHASVKLGKQLTSPNF